MVGLLGSDRFVIVYFPVMMVLFVAVRISMGIADAGRASLRLVGSRANII
jgi:hypothetical protein